MRYKRLKPVELPTDEDTQRILDILPDTITGIRNRATIMTLAASAIRVSELCDLRAQDIDLDTGRLHVRRGKGGYERRIRLFSTEGYLEKWLQARESLDLRDEDALFCAVSKGSVGNRLSRQYIHRMISLAALDAGIGKRVSPHSYRHALACRLSMLGKPIVATKAQLGHENYQSTERYLDSLGVGPAISLLDDVV